MRKYNDFVFNVIKESTSIETVEKVDKEILDKISFFYKKLKYSFNEIEEKLKRDPSTIAIENKKLSKAVKNPATVIPVTASGTTTITTTVASGTTTTTTTVAPSTITTTTKPKAATVKTTVKSTTGTGAVTTGTKISKT